MKISKPKVRRKRGHKKRRRPINFLASLLTTMNLYCGLFSIFASIGLDFESAAWYILAGIVFDILDGYVARITNSTSEFGKQLDSLSDLVTFGVAPGVLVFMYYLPSMSHLPLSPRAESVVGKTGSYMAIAYVICAALRLARYNVYQAHRRDLFIGLPSPAAGATVATFAMFLEYFEPRLNNHELGPFAYYLFGPIAVVLALLMVSNMRYPKNPFKAFVLSPGNAFYALGISAFVIAILHYAVTASWYLVLFPMCATAVIYGVANTMYHRFVLRDEEPLAQGVAPPPEHHEHKPAPQLAAFPSEASPEGGGEASGDGGRSNQLDAR